MGCVLLRSPARRCAATTWLSNHASAALFTRQEKSCCWRAIRRCANNASTKGGRAMTAYRIISADSHFVEPPTMWAERMDQKFRDRAPHTVRGHNGQEGEFFLC